MGLEIERKWLPEPELAERICRENSGKEIEQAYLCREPVIRVRREGEDYYMTYKGRGFLVKEEYNLPLTETAYNSLVLKCEGNKIQKKRFTLPYSILYPHENNAVKGAHGELFLELDIFGGNLEGLVILEAEFETEKDALSFRAPKEFGKEVTGNPEYSNAVLSDVYHLH